MTVKDGGPPKRLRIAMAVEALLFICKAITVDRLAACTIWMMLALHPSLTGAATLLPDRATLNNLLGPAAVNENFEGFVFSGPALDLGGPGAIIDSSSWPVVPGVGFTSINGGVRIDNLDFLGRSKALSVTGSGPRSLIIDFRQVVTAFGFDFLPEVLTGTEVTLTLFAPDDISIVDTKIVPVFFAGAFIGVSEPDGLGKVQISSLATQPFNTFTVRVDDLVFGGAPNDAYITRIFPPDIAVIDLSNGSMRRTIPFPPLSIPQKIAVSRDNRSLYVGDIPQNDFAKVEVVDIVSGSILEDVTVGTTGSDPIVGLELLPGGSKLYTANWTANTVTAIDLAAAITSAIIPTGNLSNDVASSSDGRRIYATALFSSDLFVIDTTTDRIVDRIDIGRDFLGHVAITPDGRKAYITEFRNRVNVVDLLARSVIGSISFDTSGANPNNIALDIEIDPFGTFAYALGYDTVNVIDLLTDTIRATIPVGKELRELDIDKDTGSVYVITAAPSTAELPFTELVKIDTHSFTIADRFVIGGDLEGIAIGRRVDAPSRPPMAEAGPDRSVECTSEFGAVIMLDGSNSSDPDSEPGTNDDIASFEWYDGFGTASQVLLGTGQILEIMMPLGQHVVTLLVRDRVGSTDVDEAVITVADTHPPDILVGLTPSLLWPPNHRLVEVIAVVNATDACSMPVVRLTTLVSTDPDDAPGTGDGQTVNDIQDVEPGTADFSFRLRAERSADGGSRFYEVIYSATDTSGNQNVGGAAAVVPHDVAGQIDPIAISISETSQGTLITWLGVAGARWYNVVRGNLSDVRETPEAISLGVGACMEAQSLDTSTAGHRDTGTPAVGEGFFYLVEYDDGGRSSFGSEGAAKPRLPLSSGCP